MQKSKYKILVAGGGSIGKRHLRNLKTLGVDSLGVVEINPKRRDEFSKNSSLLVFTDIKEALKEKWDAVFIATPPSAHIAIALEIAKTKTPMFIEKPLSHNLLGLVQLQKASQNIKPIMVGYNMDFHPQFKKIQAILKKKTLGKIWGVRAEFGQYLPDWHPKEDYSREYSARKDLGGGILLDDIHEINSLYNLFGPIEKASGFVGKLSNLKIDTEDYVEMILQFKSGIVGQIHMDYLQREPSRSLKIIGENGTLIWDLEKTKIDIYKVKNKKRAAIDEIKDYDWNETYLGETKEFLSCLKLNKNPESDLIRGIETLKIALAVKQSSALNKVIKL